MLDITTWAALAGTYLSIILFLLAVLLIASWKIFIKAGQPGWAALIPLYNIYVYTQCYADPNGGFYSISSVLCRSSGR